MDNLFSDLKINDKIDETLLKNLVIKNDISMDEYKFK